MSNAINQATVDHPGLSDINPLINGNEWEVTK